MKKITMTIAVLLFAIIQVYAQDTITLNSQEKIQAKVTDVTPTEVRYKLYDNPTGPDYVIPKSSIRMVVYENGIKEVFNTDMINEYGMTTSLSTEDYYVRGITDAETKYRGYSGAGTGTLVVSLMSPIIGLIPAIACSSTSPRDVNLGYTDSKLMKNADYSAGYRQKAKKIKQGKVWTNWLIGLGTNLAVYIVLLTRL